MSITREYDQHYKDFRKKVLHRDDYKCVECGSLKVVQVHHKKSWHDYPELRFDIDNCITLCQCCHMNIHPFMMKYVKPKDKNKYKPFKNIKVKKLRKFLKKNGMKLLKLNSDNKYKNHRFTADNPNPNWG